jgi:hypothetical protein
LIDHETLNDTMKNSQLVAVFHGDLDCWSDRQSAPKAGPINTWHFGFGDNELLRWRIGAVM